MGAKWSFAFREGPVPGRGARDQSLVVVRGTSPSYKSQGPVNLSFQLELKKDMTVHPKAIYDRTTNICVIFWLLG